MPSTPPNRSRQSGFALLIVIWGLGLLAVIATSFIVSVNTEMRIAHNVLDSATAEALADAGIHIAALKLVEASGRPSKSVDSLRTDGTPFRCRLRENAILTLIVQDEAGKVDLNAAGAPLLSALLRGLESDPKKVSEIAGAIMDFRDANSLTQINGAEQTEYRAAGFSHGPKNAKFESVEELEQVLGISATLYRRLLPFVTVHSRRNGIDPRVASSVLQRMLSGSAFSETDVATRTYSSIAENGSTSLVPAIYKIKSNRQHFRVSAAVQLSNGSRFVRDAVVEIKRQSNPPYIFKRWLRGIRPIHTFEDNGSAIRRCN